jgi:Lrp/AsnC family leucine-responsive transcriptional regulator
LWGSRFYEILAQTLLKQIFEIGEIMVESGWLFDAYLISGEYDYLIKVAVQGTAGYERFLREKLYRISGIRHSRSMFALRCMKNVPSVAV